MAIAITRGLIGGGTRSMRAAGDTAKITQLYASIVLGERMQRVAQIYGEIKERRGYLAGYTDGRADELIANSGHRDLPKDQPQKPQSKPLTIRQTIRRYDRENVKLGHKSKRGASGYDRRSVGESRGGAHSV